MKKRTTVYLDEETHSYLRKNNINLSELLAISIQKGAQNISFLKKKLAKTQKTLAELSKTSEDLRISIQKELEILATDFAKLNDQAKNYVIQTQNYIEAGRFTIIGRYKSYVKQFGNNINYGQFVDLIDHLDIILEKIEQKEVSNETNTKDMELEQRQQCNTE